MNLFAPFTVGLNNNTANINKSIANAADSCKIIKVSFISNPSNTSDPKWLSNKPTVTLNANTLNCIGGRLSGYIREDSEDLPLGTNFPDQKISADNFSLNFKPGEYECRGGECKNTNFYLFIHMGDETVASATYDSKSDNKTFSYKCRSSNCADEFKWTLDDVSGLEQKIAFNFDVTSTKNSINIKGTGPQPVYDKLDDADTLTFSIADSAGKLLDNKSVKETNPTVKKVKSELYDSSTEAITYDVTFTGLAMGTTYTISVTPKLTNLTLLNKTDTRMIATLDSTGQQVGPGPSSGSINTLKQEQKDSDHLPACGIIPGQDGNVYGCLAQILYYGLFMPTSFLFGLAGTFFDNTFAYSVNDASYRSTFVIQGWGIVRDLCNMFFIFVLLYVAFATILQIDGFNTKSTVINVVIIGVLINFSLFATQMIIDTSNILARVFYNSNTIKITENGANGVTNNSPGLEVGADGVIPLSAALVNKVNPQNLIINATSVGQIPDDGGQGVNNPDGIEAGTFILITILASAINIVGFLTFLSVGLIFVARIIGLWFAMILVPFTFFTYMIPQMQNFSMVGWKKWWPETISLAFLAPVFIFFLYLILKFLQVGLGVFSANGKQGIDFVVAIVLPFAFIMVLLNRAKDIAKNMSGEMGQAITGGIAKVGGMALGGAALGAASLGRSTLGTVSKYAMSDDKTRKEALTFQDTRNAVKNVSWNPTTWAKVATTAVGGLGKATAAGIGAGVGKLRVGGVGVKETAEKVEHVDHARHEIDGAKAKTKFKDVPIDRLSTSQLNEVKDEFVKPNKGKYEKEEEEKYRKANKLVSQPALSLMEKTVIRDTKEKEYRITNNLSTGPLTQKDSLAIQKAADTEIKKTNEERKKEPKLTTKQKEEIKANVDARGVEEFNRTLKDSKEKVSNFARAIASSNTGTYDPRNLSQITTDPGKRDGLLSRTIANVTVLSASSLRSGLRSMDVNHGVGKGDFMDDIVNVIQESLKGIKVSVPRASGGGSHGGGGHGGGGHGGGGHGGGH